MKKKIITALLSILLLTSCSANHNTDEIIENKINFIDGIYGVYGQDNGPMDRDIIDVYKGIDDNHIDVRVFKYGKIAFDVDDMEITSNKDGKVMATKSIKDEENIICYIKEDQDLDDAKLDVELKDNKIKVEFNKELKEDTMERIVEKEKSNLKCITEEEKQKALDNILNSNFRNINNEIFDVIQDTENYLVVRVKCHVYFVEENIRFYDIEGSESIGMYKYYNIDKKNKKILELDDIILNIDDVNEYINKEIAKKREKWNEEENGKWEYGEFERIGEPEFFENYFLVDEEKETVKIRCFGFLNKESGDLCIEVPFEYFKLYRK